jgi:tetratricopeptide (TPR) repeat protein
MYADTLKLIVTLTERRPSPQLPEQLHTLFRRLGDGEASERDEVEDEIWRLWMTYPVGLAAFDLERATRAMMAEDWGVADQILRAVVGSHPDYAEAWNKRATLYYIHRKDVQSVHCIHRTLELEPRHYGAICGFAEILLSRGDADAALFVFEQALRINPHLDPARKAINQLLALKPAVSH